MFKYIYGILFGNPKKRQIEFESTMAEAKMETMKELRDMWERDRARYNLDESFEEVHGNLKET